MAVDRTTGRLAPRKRTPEGRPGPRPDGRKKFTAYLPPDLIRRLKHLAIDEGKDLGELAAPVLWSLVGQRYQVHRRPDAEPPALRAHAPPDPAGADAAEPAA